MFNTVLCVALGGEILGRCVVAVDVTRGVVSVTKRSLMLPRNSKRRVSGVCIPMGGVFSDVVWVVSSVRKCIIVAYLFIEDTRNFPDCTHGKL